MTFEEFEKADESKLREAAKERFEFGTKHPATPMAAPSLLEAQFYMRELEYRSEKRIHGQERSLDKRVSNRTFFLKFL